MRGFEADYERRLQAMIARRTGPVKLSLNEARQREKWGEEAVYRASPIYEVYERLGQEGSAVRYTVGAMARIDPRYTEITYEQGDRVKNQLDGALKDANSACDFEYQGSVTNDTHIKSYSDIDLLAITRKFWTLEPPQKPSSPYEGNPIQDLRDIRSTSCKTLRDSFPAADVDDSGAKAVAISGGSLSRKIDVVAANWFDTNAYAQNRAKRFRAVQILNIRTGERDKNMPFMHNFLIDQRDTATSGGLRKVVRLMKSLKYDSGSIDLTSYDIAAIGYNMPEHLLATYPSAGDPLLARLKGYLDSLVVNSGFSVRNGSP